MHRTIASRRAGALSGGMKQKLALSCALIHRPEILVLDEPTFGVDPVSRVEFWELLRSIRAAGTTIIVSTAYMDEADMCDRVALLFGGRIIAGGTPRELKAGYPYPLYRIAGRDVHALRTFFAGMAGAAGSSDSLGNAGPVSPGGSGSARARARGIAVHAWVNVLLAAHFGQPLPRGHVLERHPERLSVAQLLSLAGALGFDVVIQPRSVTVSPSAAESGNDVLPEW